MNSISLEVSLKPVDCSNINIVYVSKACNVLFLKMKVSHQSWLLAPKSGDSKVFSIYRSTEMHSMDMAVIDLNNSRHVLLFDTFPEVEWIMTLKWVSWFSLRRF